MRHAPIDDYIARLRSELAANPALNRSERKRLLEECAEHLHDLALEARQHDCASLATQLDVVRRFGDPRDVVSGWADATDIVSPVRWNRWVAFSTVGLLVGLALGIPAAQVADVWLGMLMFLPAAGLVVGACVGASQSVLLKPRVAKARPWVLASAIGMGAGLTAGTTAVELLGLQRGVSLHEGLALVIIGGASGVCLGLLQWIVLRRRFRGAGWWIVVSVLATGAGFLAAGVSTHALLEGLTGAAGLAFFAIVYGLISGSITGLALNRLAPG